MDLVVYDHNKTYGLQSRDYTTLTDVVRMIVSCQP